MGISHLYLNREAHNVLESLSDNTSKICHLYNPFGLFEDGKGSCSKYYYRGLICRLFGYGASSDKYGKLRLATCKIIKDNQSILVNNSENLIHEGLSVPVFTNYYMRLSQIDFHLGNKIVPINIALKLAIEEVLNYYMYRSFEDEVVPAA